MKKLLIGLLALGSISSFACVEATVNDSKVRFCVGDKVTTEDSTSKYKIESINHYTQTFLLTNRHYGDKRKTANELGILKGCMQNFCVGDKVTTDDSTSTYKIESINHYTQTFLLTNRHYGPKRKTANELGVLKGCMQSICVGDKVTTYYKASKYKIKSINHYTQTFLLTNRHNGAERKTASQLGVLNYCTDYSNADRYSSNN